MSVLVGDIEVTSPDMIVIRGDEAFAPFKEFVESNFIWCFSGIDWTKTSFIDQMRWARYDKDSFLTFAKRNNFKGKKKVSFYNAGHGDFLIEADIVEISNLLDRFENESDEIYTLDFWLFDLEDLTLIEIYHDGTVTFARSAV